MVKVSRSNNKLGNIMSINLPPIKSCGGLPCHKYCYAIRYYKQYPAVRKAYDSNLLFFQDFEELYWLHIGHELQKYKGQFVRFHASGECPTYEYLLGVINVAKEFPLIRFLLFTKRYEWVNRYLAKGDIPNNLSIVLSAWPEYPLANPLNLPVAYVRDKAGLEDRIPKEAFDCVGSCEECKICWNLQGGQSVVFSQH